MSSAAAFRAAEASGPSWSDVVHDCAEQLEPLPEGANLGFLYVTDALAEHLGSMLTFLRERTRVADWVGSVGVGVCGGANEYFEQPAAAALVGALPPDGFRVFSPQSDNATKLRAEQDGWLERTEPILAIVHGDPRAPSLSDTIARLARDASLYLLGGVAAGASAPQQIAGRVVEGGLSGVLLSPRLPVISGLSQGCSPIGPVRRITEAQDNVILTIDDRPALDVLKQDMGELLSRNLRRVAGLIFAAFPVSGSDTGDYLVRNLVAIDPQRGWLAVAHEVEAGDPMLFCRRDPASATRDFERMLQQLKQRAGRPVRAGLYFSCVARGPQLFGPGSREIAMIRDILGDFPLAGFFGNGEIANDRVYGYTGVLAVFL
jgi:small ligand-binding sensory domain FIST